MSNLPVASTYVEVVRILRDMADRVEAGDSFEGSIEYSMPGPSEENGVCLYCGSAVLDGEHLRDDLAPCLGSQPEVVVRAAYRVGNSMGQGGMRIIGLLG